MAKEVQTKRILLLKKLKLSIKLQNGIKQMATKLGMFSVTHESVTVPVGRDKKIRTAKRTNQFSGFITMPSEEKKDHTLHIFWYQQRERIWKNVIISGENDKAKPPKQSKEGIRRCQLFIIPKTTLLLWDRGGFRLNLNLCTRCCSWLALSLCLQRSMPPMFCHS